ncbi:O-antigen ligase family protein [Candidatus Poribacteria bacterium]|nr:O-antigen ligase family protein [Candidatus Poribacteria bacterium]MYK17067.1 O-antigen ligase family protein [Candidatus Poribacteria bacterium]
MSELKFLLPSRWTSAKVFGTVTYIGLFVFVLALPFGYSTAFLNIGLSLVLFGWIGRIVSERKLGWQRTPLDLPIALFLGSALIASLFAPHPSTSSLGYFWKLLRAILLFYAVVHSRLGTRWRHVVIVFIAAASISSTLGLWYYVNDTRLALDFMGRIGLQFQEEFTAAEGFSDELRAELRTCRVPLSETAFHVTDRKPSAQLDTWRIDDPARDRRYTIRPGETHLMVYMIEQRLTGTFKMPNDLGAYLALSLPFVIGYFAVGLIATSGQRSAVSGQQCVIRKDSSLPKTENRKLISITVILGIILVLMSANLVLTLTRAAWVSVTLAIIFSVSYLTISTLSTTIPWKRGLLVLVLMSIVGGVLLLNTNARQALTDLVPRHIKTRFQTMITHPAGFMSERPQWWRMSLQFIQQYPLTGIGPGRFRYEYQLNGPPEQYDTPYHAHNIYLHIAAEQGIPSLLLFLWIVAIICQSIFAMRQATDFWGMGTFIGASGFLISALVYGLADNILHQRTVLLFWFIIGIIFYSQLSKDTKYEKNSDTG